MATKHIPRFYGLRIYLSSILLYFFLVLPFIGFIVFQSIPEFLENRNINTEEIVANADSVLTELDSLPEFTEGDVENLVDLAVHGDLDNLLNEAILVEEEISDSVGQISEQSAPPIAGADSMAVANEEEERLKMFSDKGPFSRYFRLLFILLAVSLLAGFIYNRPFKRYFKRKQRGKDIREKLLSTCKKRLFNLPLVNSLIVTMPNIVVIVYSFIFLITKVSFDEEVERSMFMQLHYLTIVATLLEFLFVYYWQKHRVHIRYIHHIFSETELRKQVFNKKRGKIRNRFMVASGMTTFLPLMVVMVYLVLSLTSIKKLNVDEYSEDHREVLFGPWSEIIGIGEDLVANNDNGIEVDPGGKDKFFYVNAIDSIVMLVGIGNGILVSFIYLLLFIRWTNRDLSWPLKELLNKFRTTREGNLEQYSIVRTNDEIGELAEGYNEMTEKIHNYVESISSMNRDLEKKVMERTREVVEQKEEIETQKEEIEAQLDLATLQRDTIAKQKDLIMDSIHYAERIQSAILPPTNILKKYLSEHFILFKPRDIVSGDFYWAREKDQKLLIAAADCTGHGVPGGFLSMLGISSMNEIVNRSSELNPGKILEQLREVVIASMHQTGSRDEAQDGIEIALCVIDTKKKTMVYAGANRPLYLLRDGVVEHFRADRMPIGIYEQEALPFKNHSIKLKKGDAIYLFSDGYVDQLGGPKRKTFRAINFRALLLEIQDQPMEKQLRILSEKMALWQGEIEQIDDVLVMGFKI